MHRIDGDAQYPTGHFSEGDPLVPRLPTQVTAAWLDDVQEELVNLVFTAGFTLIKGAHQLSGVLANLTTEQTFTALKTFIRAGTAAVFENNDVGSTAPAVDITHTGQLALRVTGDSHVVDGSHTVSGRVTGATDISTPRILLGHDAANAPINLGVGYASGDPTNNVVGDVWFTNIGSACHLCTRTGPSTVKRVELT